MEDRLNWGSFATDYEDRVFSVMQFRPERQRVLEAGRPGALLDLGCGPSGRLLRDAANSGWDRVYGSDFSLDMLCVAAKQVTGTGAELILADNRALPFQSEALETVIAINSILPEERHQISPMFSEVSRVLTSEGRFVAIVPSFEMSLIALKDWGLDVVIDYENRRERDTTGWQAFYTQADIEELLNLHAFKLVHYERLYFDSKGHRDAIRRVYGPSLSDAILQTSPLFEHFFVAARA